MISLSRLLLDGYRLYVSLGQMDTQVSNLGA